jgi:hypothetical protein
MLLDKPVYAPRIRFQKFPRLRVHLPQLTFGRSPEIQIPKILVDLQCSWAQDFR